MTPDNTPTPQAGETPQHYSFSGSGMVKDDGGTWVRATAILTLQSQLQEALDRIDQQNADFSDCMCNLRKDIVVAAKHEKQWKADLKGMTDLAIEHEDRAESAESEVVKLRAALEKVTLRRDKWKRKWQELRQRLRDHAAARLGKGGE